MAESGLQQQSQTQGGQRQSQIQGGGGLLAGYNAGGFWCEFYGRGREPLPACVELARRLNAFSFAEIARRAKRATSEFMTLGITFTVYSDARRDRPHPAVRRHPAGRSPAEEWAALERGVIQRVARDEPVPARRLRRAAHPEGRRRSRRELVLGNANYRPEMVGFDSPHGTYVHICGTDIVRDGNGEFLRAGGQRAARRPACPT